MLIKSQGHPNGASSQSKNWLETKGDKKVFSIRNEKIFPFFYTKKYGFTIDYVDPRDIIRRDDVSIEIFKGKFVNMYVLRKI